MPDVVIVDAVRTAIGKRGGALADIRPDDLAAIVLEALVKRSGIDSLLIEDVILGCVTQIKEQGWNIARLATLSAGLPETVPATTVNRMCGSGQQSVHSAAQSILAGDMDIAIAGGVESMSRIKMGSDGKDLSPRLLSKYALVWQGSSAELMAEKYQLTRQDLDSYSLESHRRACQAIEKNNFAQEIIPVDVSKNGKTSLFECDEGPRKDTSMEQLASLKTPFKENGVVTAGNASQISDGAAALLLMSSDKAFQLGLKPKARIVARVVVGSDPILMLDGILSATRKALSKAGLSVNDMDTFEVNEAFASPVLAWLKEFGVNTAKVNPTGGAIALGHPLGASGSRIMVTMLNELERHNGRFGLQTMCIGHGMATATIIERL